MFLSGKYMQMMNVLKPIAFDVMICMSQLFDYYLYAVSMKYHIFFDYKAHTSCVAYNAVLLLHSPLFR